MYKRILVATGGSPWSAAAVAYATRLAARIDAELRLLTVLPFPAAEMISEMLAVEDLMDSIEQEGKMRLINAATHATWAGVAYESRLEWGNIPETILRVAEEEACDLIILGSRGLTGWKRLMLGSISNAVAAKARPPVLVVKQNTPLTPDALAWRRILVATSGTAWSEAAVEEALRLTLTSSSAVYLLHVERTRPSRSPAPTPADRHPILAPLAARLTAAGVPVYTRLAYGDVVRAILDTATAEQCDSIILGSRGLTGWKRLMLGSTSNAVAAKALQPVLLVKHFVDG